ncbi:MAG: hypothetical protein ISS45_05805 [Candidatus Omnitrophica bacterium]|nr:hypothetical protein [Candidatus Omnitrophota bacterium]
MDFKAPYERKNYRDFFQNQFLPEDFESFDEDIELQFKSQHINKVAKIGQVPSLDLSIYEIEHQSENDPRVSLSRDSFRLLSQYSQKRALILFIPQKTSNYRFSFVTIDLKWEEGRRPSKEYSNPRRYSFFLGPDAKAHTPEEYLIKEGRIEDFEDLKSRFSIEVVNKDFYTKIAILFTRLAGGKRKIGRKTIDVGRGLLDLPGTVDDTLDKEFTVRLIGRLVFCWFLKKKVSNQNIPLLPEVLLSAQAVSENKNYYHHILEPLFFEVLNTPIADRKDKYQNSLWSQIPFLNGGLFTPHYHDFYEPGALGISKHINTLNIPDHWIKELFEIFETYNFTIDENTTIDVELSIEPEMLGRIFENLLAEINPETGETARKATGSYYTPRPIVEYMVDESLKQYLLTKTKLKEAQIKSLLTYEEVEIKLSESEKESVLNALDSIKIIDPACGSGAFPMGILQKMFLMLQKIDPKSEWWLDKKLAQIEDKLLKKELGKKLKAESVNYVHKLGIIQSSIYGVDIQPIAVEISKLRFFLSLIVDETINEAEENRGIEPLPNLEFKFVCTNSLIGLPKKEKNPDELFETEDIQSINELKDLRDEYLRSYGAEKEKIQIKFLKIQKRMVDFYWQRVLKPQSDLYGNERKIKKQDLPEFTRMLSKWDPFSDESAGWFDAEWMFGIKDGFDVVIGNPPYGFRDVLTPEEKVYFRTVEKIEFSSGDSAELFSRKCFDNLVKHTGILTFIIPKKSLYGDAWEGYRKDYWLKYNLRYLIDSSKAFENVLLEMNVFGLEKSSKNSFVTCGYLRKDNTILEFATGSKADVFLENFTAQIYKLIIPDSLWGKIQNKKASACCVTGRLGLAIGKDFYSDTETDYKLLKGIDITRWQVKTNRWLRNKSKLNWDNAKEFLKPKIICQRLIAHIENPVPHIKITACYDEEGVLITNTLMSFELHDRLLPKFWLAYLNSTFISWYAYNLIYAQAIRSMDFYNFYIQQIPIPESIINKSSDQKPVIEIVDKILAHSQSNDYLQNASKQAKVEKYERQIDQMVYKLYGLNKEEIGIVEKAVV